MKGIFEVMKNYYEILQVNENASNEKIEKAYKVLAKKYHPDLQKDDKVKTITEKKLKEINEAYDVLSNEFLKEQYDLELKKEREKELEKKYGKQTYGTEKNNFYEPPQKTAPKVEKTEQKNSTSTLTEIINLVKMIYKDKPKRQEYKETTKKDLLAIFLTIIVVIAIGIILWYIPFTNGWIRELTIENPIFQWIGKFFAR